jgi:hypothetical protein
MREGFRNAAGWLVLVAAAACTGCGSATTVKYKVAPVAGTVTLNGKPLANAQISFEPTTQASATESSPGSYSTTGTDGRYTLQLVTTDKTVVGAVVGPHRVSITVPNDGGSSPDAGPAARPKPNPVPARYNSQSELTFDVPAEGTEKADFSLKSP